MAVWLKQLHSDVRSGRSDSFGYVSPENVLLRKRSISDHHSIANRVTSAEDEDDEDDYMSDKFLQQVCDVKPGLSKYTKKSSNPTKYTPPPPKRSASEIQKDKLEEGLKKKISCENVGFNMLVKMGYQPGKGLGRSEDGRAEPVPISLMSHREGLGHATERKDRVMQHAALQKHRARMDDRKRNDFRAQMSARFRRQAVGRKLTSAQHLCRRLDSEKFEFESPLVPGYWPKGTDLNGEVLDEEDEEENDEDPELLLLEISSYLRSTHFYCFWCGAQFADAEELEEKCPGESEEDHG